MLNINKKLEDKTLTVTLEGRLDTTTAPQLEAELKSDLADVTSLVMDFEKLEYISSAGLRVLMTAQKAMMSAGGKVVVTSPNSMVKGVLDMTGLSGVFEIV
jgi:anti-sigma B factor antagonist